MRRRTLVVVGAGVAVVVAAATALALAPDRHERKTTVLRPPTSSAGPPTTAPRSARCRAVAIALPPQMRAQGETMVGLVRARSGSGKLNAAGATFLLLDLNGPIDYGPWEAAVRYLERSAKASVEHIGSQPDLTPDVLASAGRVDRDLSAGVCG